MSEVGGMGPQKKGLSLQKNNFARRGISQRGGTGGREKKDASNTFGKGGKPNGGERGKSNENSATGLGR